MLDFSGSILDAIPYGVFVLDMNREICFWNNAMQELTGISAKEATGSNCQLITANWQNKADCPILAGMQAKPTWEPVQLTHRDGTIVSAMRFASVLTSEDGEPEGVVTVISDRDMNLPHEPVLDLQEPNDDVVQRLVGESAPMRDVRERIRLAAQSEATVLILGETGTGKERVAEAIHYGSSRRNGPLVKVNCSALSENLLESELFGHVAGAFTGAIRDKVGRFEAAEGGTIFLDEIGDVSPLIQLKLLRVLQERQVERVGESKSRDVNVRVLAATNKNLREMVRSGGIREDFYYRIRVFPIHVPPLRMRREDIPALSNLFISRFAKDTGKKVTSLGPMVSRIFMDYCWPGNVRELENTIEHGFVTCEANEIGVFDLPYELRTTEMRLAECKAGASEEAPLLFTVPKKKSYDKDDLVALLQEFNWNKSEVARHLGVARTTIWRQMKQWGISQDA